MNMNGNMMIAICHRMKNLWSMKFMWVIFREELMILMLEERLKMFWKKSIIWKNLESMRVSDQRPSTIILLCEFSRTNAD